MHNLLNYDTYYTLHSDISFTFIYRIFMHVTHTCVLQPSLQIKTLKLLKCITCTINYETYYTLHPDISFTVIYRIFMHVTRTCVLQPSPQIKTLKP